MEPSAKSATRPTPAGKRRVLVITPEPLPLPEQATTGAGLRAWGLAMGLRARGFDAVVASCNVAFADVYLSGQLLLPDYVRMFQRHRVDLLLDTVKPEVVILQHWGMAHEVPELDVPLVIDLAGPHLLERHFWGSPDLLRDAEAKLAALRRADFVVCSGRYQRHYFYAWLVLAGFDLRQSQVPIIPFSVPPRDQLPSGGDRERHSFVYGGMLLAWQDPSRALRIVVDEIEHAGQGRLHIYTGVHPVLDASANHLAELTNDLRGHSCVEFHGIVPFHKLLEEYSRYEVALDLMAWNPERELAFTTRTMIYLACGLPVIHNDFSEVAELLRQHGGGWTVSPDDEAGLRRLCRAVLHDECELAPARAAALALAEKFTWEKTIEPLAQFCEAPYFRAEKAKALLRVERLDTELNLERERRVAAEAELARLRGKALVKLASRLSGAKRLLAPVVKAVMWPIALAIEWLLLRQSRPR